MHQEGFPSVSSEMASQIESPPDRFPVSVVMERRRLTDNPWVSESWRLVGITPGALAGPGPSEPRLLVEGESASQYLWTGHEVRLFPDEAESYYHNLTVERPCCYVMTRPRPDGMPRPEFVTLSFDAGQAYQEGGETLYSAPLPPALYRAVEAYVLAHYVPERRRKRERTNWKEGGHAGR